MAKIVTFFIVLLAFCLAIYGWRDQVVWGYDQARDAFEAYNIWHSQDFKVIGPATDIVGVYHGPLWFYFLAVLYFFTHGDPVFVSLVFVAFLFLSLPVVYILARKLFADPLVGLIAVSLAALSPLFQIYTRWMSNPMLALYVSPLLLIFLWSYFNKPTHLKAALSGLFYGLLVQSNVAFGVFVFLIFPMIWLFDWRFSFKETVGFIVGLLAGVATFMISDFKFGGRTSLALLGFATKESGIGLSASGSVLKLFDRIFDFIYLTVFPAPKIVIVTVVAAILAVVYFKKIKFDHKPVIFLLIWLSNILIFQLVDSAISGSAFVFAPSLAPMTILFSYLIVLIAKKYPKAIICVAVFFLAQFGLNKKWLLAGYSPVSVQHGITLSASLKAIDYMYGESGKKPFIITSLTNPLFINTNWAYLFQFYGLPRYGFLPFWHGKSQTGYLGNLPPKEFDTDLRFLIIEPTSGIPDVYVAKAVYEEDKFSDILEEKRFAGIRIQKRQFHPNKLLPEPPQELLLAPKILAE